LLHLFRDKKQLIFLKAQVKFCFEVMHHKKGIDANWIWRNKKQDKEMKVK